MALRSRRVIINSGNTITGMQMAVVAMVLSLLGLIELGFLAYLISTGKIPT
jgi:hypothetical protein